DAAEHLTEVGRDQDGDQHHGHERDQDQGGHDLLERPVTLQPDHDESDDTADHRPVPHGEPVEQGVQRQRGRRHRGRAVDETPDDDVDAEEAGGPIAEAAPAVQQRGAGGHVPAADSLAEREFQRRSHYCRPQQDRAVLRACHHRGDQVTRADTGRRGHQSWSEPTDFGLSRRHLGGCRVRAGGIAAHGLLPFVAPENVGEHDTTSVAGAQAQLDGFLRTNLITTQSPSRKPKPRTVASRPGRLILARSAARWTSSDRETDLSARPHTCSRSSCLLTATPGRRASAARMSYSLPVNCSSAAPTVTRRAARSTRRSPISATWSALWALARRTTASTRAISSLSRTGLTR